MIATLARWWAALRASLRGAEDAEVQAALHHLDAERRRAESLAGSLGEAMRELKQAGSREGTWDGHERRHEPRCRS